MNDIYVTERFESALRVAGYKAPRWQGREESEAGFFEYYEEVCGESELALTADELLRPRRFKENLLLPPRMYWPRSLYLAHIATRCRGSEPIYCAWNYRPEPVNTRYGGKPNKSTHIWGYAIDLDFSSPIQLQKALKDFLHPMYQLGETKYMGLGVGRMRIHVDFFSHYGDARQQNRWWKYESWSTYQGPGSF